MLKVLIASVLATLPLIAVSAEPRWVRCNTHTHTTAPANSDANGTPWFVARWYKEQGYQCLIITDHEHATEVDSLNRRFGPDFVVISGQEITQGIADSNASTGIRPAHVNGIGIERLILPLGHPGPARGVSTLDTFRRNIAAVVDAGGVAQVNHPNLQWSVSAADLEGIEGPFLLEIWNAFPTHNNLGGTDEHGRRRASTEELWDALLSRGQVVWGVASDDVHEYYDLYDPSAPTPGKGWIVLRVGELTRTALMTALRRGDFYASNGVVLESYSADDSGIELQIGRTRFWNSDRPDDRNYTTRFIGANGELLAEVPGLSPAYRFRGTERYVRASIVDSDGRRAWTQPYFREAAARREASPAR